MSDNVGQSYNEQILQSIIDGTTYENENPYPSRIEVLLMALKEAIEAGGGSVVVDQTYSAESTNAQSGTAVAQAISGKANSADLGTAAAKNTTSILDSSTNLVESGVVKRVTDGIGADIAEMQELLDTIKDYDTVTNSATIADTGVTVDIPADGGIYEISACAEWGGSPPSEIQIRMTYGTRTTNYLLSRSTAANDDNKNYTYLSTVCVIKPTARYPGEDNIHHISVWAKAAAASGSNSITLIARKISD